MATPPISLVSLLITTLTLLSSAHATDLIAKPKPQDSWPHAPTHFGILVFPGFQPLDVYGPLDVLWALGPISINQPVKLSVIGCTLDPVDTRPPPMADPNNPGHNMTHNGDFSVKIVPTITLEELLERQGSGLGGDGDDAESEDEAEDGQIAKRGWPHHKHKITKKSSSTPTPTLTPIPTPTPPPSSTGTSTSSFPKTAKSCCYVRGSDICVKPISKRGWWWPGPKTSTKTSTKPTSTSTPPSQSQSSTTLQPPTTTPSPSSTPFPYLNTARIGCWCVWDHCYNCDRKKRAEPTNMPAKREETDDENENEIGMGHQGGNGNGNNNQDETEEEEEWSDIEVLIVPGGAGTRGDVSREIAFVKEMYPKLKYILSICTGATILARADILNGHKATTNKKAWAWATSTGPNVTWVPSARWVEDANIWTSSGVAAGTDATLAWVDRVYGRETGNYIAAALEIERWEGGPGRDPFAKVWGVPGAV